MAEGRLLQDWLQGYLEFTDELESPESFHLWTALGTVSAALRRRVYLEMVYGTIYPNLYMIMVAASAELRKSTAANFGRNLLMDALTDINVMQDSMTSQGLVKSLNQKRSVVDNGVVVEKLQSDVAIYADEVANLFSYDKIRASTMTIFLTRTYECPNTYEHTTSRDNKIRLFNLYPVLVGCTDPKNLRTIPSEAADGLVGRMLWIIEHKRRTANPGFRRDSVRAARNRLLREALMHDLRRISALSGEMTVEEDAMNFYEEWYMRLAAKEDIDQDSKAFYHRCHSTVLRLSMILSITKSEKLIVTQQDMKGAIALIEQQLPANQRINIWKGNSDFEVKRAKYISYLASEKGITTRAKLLKHMGVPADEFDKLTYTFIQDGTVRVPEQKVKGQTVIMLMEVPQDLK